MVIHNSFYKIIYNLLLAFFLGMFIYSCSSKKILILGQKLPKEILQKQEESPPILVMTSASSFNYSYNITVDNIDFFMAVDKDNKIIYIGTTDKNFITSEGINIGSTLQDVMNVSEKSMIKETGWAYYVPLPSGWNAAFTEGEEMTGEEPSEKSNVKWLFKR